LLRYWRLIFSVATRVVRALSPRRPDRALRTPYDEARHPPSPRPPSCPVHLRWWRRMAHSAFCRYRESRAKAAFAARALKMPTTPAQGEHVEFETGVAAIVTRRFCLSVAAAHTDAVVPDGEAATAVRPLLARRPVRRYRNSAQEPSHATPDRVEKCARVEAACLVTRFVARSSLRTQRVEGSSARATAASMSPVLRSPTSLHDR